MIDRIWRIALFVAYRAQLVYWFVFRPTEPSAHVAVWWDGEILVTHSSYRRHVSMPAGSVKRGETPAAAACRELREEVGIRAEVAELRAAGQYSSRQQFKEDLAHVFELRLDRAPEVAVDGREVVRAEFEPPARVLSMHASDILLQYLRARTGR